MLNKKINVEQRMGIKKKDLAETQRKLEFI
jgi:hypothetical protein